MTTMLKKSTVLLHNNLSVRFASKVTAGKNLSCKLLVLGATTGGLAVAHRFARRLRMKELVILDPNKYHYFIDQLCLVGTGVKSLDSMRAETRHVLPDNALWVQAAAKSIDVDSSSTTVTTSENKTIKCEYMVIALDLEPSFHCVPGLAKALSDPKSGVCATYSPKYAHKTWETLRAFKGGNAIFAKGCPYSLSDTFSYGSWADCMAYLADSYFKTNGVRSKTNISLINHWPVINGIEKYNNALVEVMKSRNICYHSGQELQNVDPTNKEITFNGVKRSYDLLHVSYYGFEPVVVKKFDTDTPSALDLNIETLQHNKYPRIYGLGECLRFGYQNPFSTGIQSYVVEQNLLSTMQNKPLTAKFNGYRLRPYMTSDDSCILAEWIGINKKDFKIHETFICDQAKPSRFAHCINRYLIPQIYWNCIIKGRYNGHEWLRKIFHPFGY